MTPDATVGTTFVDTNVLAYAHDLSETEKRPVAQRALQQLWLSGTGVLSVQVLQEFYNVVTRKFRPPMPPPEARRLIADYATWEVVSPDAALVLDASLLESSHPISFWDALIVEAARRAGADVLLTEDLQHGQNFGGITIQNPFHGLDEGAS